MDYGINRVSRLVEYMTAKKYSFIDAVQIIANTKPSKSKLEEMYRGHATAKGNQVLADILFGQLRQLAPSLVN